ncbi:MAG: 50S ribosomal protein L11 methyltransferase [Mesorhizobium sp.]
MTQVRHFFRTDKAAAQSAFNVIEVAFEDEGLPVALFEVDEDTGLHEISLYAEDGDRTPVERLASILTELGLPAAIEREAIPDIDWVTKSLEGLKPVRAGRFLVHGSHDRDKLTAGEIGIEIEAGQAFGTGHHGTTAGCLSLIGEVVANERPANALDLGTGSAVLAIAIAKLSDIPVLATDIDPVAIEVAAQNVTLNGVSGNVTCVVATDVDHPAFAQAGPFDLVVANILANPLIGLAPSLTGQIARKGSLILSGILESQHDAVVAAYVAQGLRHVSTLPLEGWVSIHLKP